MIPASSSSRVTAVDALRGFALFGILVVNSAAFASPYYGSGLDDPAFSSSTDTVIRFLIASLFESKFYLLFSFLFGYSFTLQLASAARVQRPPLPPFLRRLAMLFCLGVAHACLLYPGDILTIYALTGLLLIPLRHLPPRRCLTISVGLILLMSIAVTGLGLSEWGTQSSQTTPEQVDIVAAATLASYQNGLLATIRFNTREWTETVWLFLLMYQGPHALAMFLLGLVAGNRGLLQGDHLTGRCLWRVLLLGGPVGLAGGLAIATAQTGPVDAAAGAIITGLADLTAPLLTASLGATVILLIRRFPHSLPAIGITAAGQMALTNLPQSVAVLRRGLYRIRHRPQRSALPRRDPADGGVVLWRTDGFFSPLAALLSAGTGRMPAAGSHPLAGPPPDPSFLNRGSSSGSGAVDQPPRTRRMNRSTSVRRASD